MDPSKPLSKTMRLRIGEVGSEKREDMPAEAFLLGQERKYPVMTDVGGKWHHSPILLNAAAKRARMQGRNDLASKAEAILKGLKK